MTHDLSLRKSKPTVIEQQYEDDIQPDVDALADEIWALRPEDRAYLIQRISVGAPWEHPYTTERGDTTCIYCGQVGAYIHTAPEDRMAWTGIPMPDEPQP